MHAMLESRGGRTIELVSILWGFVPIGLAVLAGVISDRFASQSIWLLGCSPLSGAFYASGTTMPPGDMPLDIKRALPGAFWFWQGVFALIAIWLIVGLVRSRKEVAQMSLGEKVVAPDR